MRGVPWRTRVRLSSVGLWVRLGWDGAWLGEDRTLVGTGLSVRDSHLQHRDGGNTFTVRACLVKIWQRLQKCI